MNNQIRFASGLMTGSTEKKAETEKRLTPAGGKIESLQSQERSLSLADFLTDVMRCKLLRRTQRQKNIPQPALGAAPCVSPKCMSKSAVRTPKQRTGFIC
jgi:hypothetical protein